MSRTGTGARDQVARLLTLVPLLHARGELGVAEAADALGTTPKQLVKDLKVLWMCGLPGGYPDDLIDIDMDALTDPGGDGTIRVWNADYLARPVRLAPTEASALVVALRSLRETAGADAVEVVDRALAKLEQAASAGAGATPLPVALARTDTSVADAARAEAEVARTWTAALEQGRRIEMTYWSQARDASRPRVVDPLQIATVEGHTYLQAWCTSADALRVFRADRATEVRISDQVAAHHADVELRDLAADLFGSAEDVPVVPVRLGPRARWVASYHPVEAARETRDGALEVDLVVGDPAWLDALVLRVAPDAVPLTEPARTRVLSKSRAALTFYS